MWKKKHEVRHEDLEKRVEYNERSIRDSINELVIGIQELRGTLKEPDTNDR